MRLRELMRTHVVTIEANESASAAWSRMQRKRIRHLVVTADGDLAGVISERDLGGPNGRQARTGHSVEDLMNPRVVSAEPSTTLREAANIMRGRMIGSLPVLEHDELVGIVTATDVLDALGRGSTRPIRRREPRSARTTARRARSAGGKVIRRARVKVPVGRARVRQPESERRAPFGSLLPKTLKLESVMDLAQIPTHIRTTEGDLSADDREYVRRKLGRRLGKFADSIERVSVRTEDVNGPRGGVDRVCRIKVVLSGLPSVVVEKRDSALNAAIDGALAGVEKTVRRALQRRRMRPLRRVA